MMSADVFPTKLCRFPGTKDRDAVRFVLCGEHALGPSVRRGRTSGFAVREPAAIMSLG